MVLQSQIVSSLLRSKKRWLLTTAVLVITSAFLINVKPAAAHHLLDGRIPANFFEGFMTGLAHPIIGLDHFAFVLAIGCLAAGLPRGFLLPGCFLAAAMAGTGIHLLGVSLPLTEIAVSLSVIIIGIILAFKPNLNVNIIAALGALAGLFHGYAYGESIFGAEMTPLLSYLAGFTIMQFGIALFGMVGANVASQKFSGRGIWQRWLGLGISSIGLVFLSQLFIH